VTGWRAALRVARRSVRRHLGRSLLVIALIAVPVAGATVTDGLVRTMSDWEVDLDRAMGTADARIYCRVGRRARCQWSGPFPDGPPPNRT